MRLIFGTLCYYLVCALHTIHSEWDLRENGTFRMNISTHTAAYRHILHHVPTSNTHSHTHTHAQTQLQTHQMRTWDPIRKKKISCLSATKIFFFLFSVSVGFVCVCSAQTQTTTKQKKKWSKTTTRKKEDGKKIATSRKFQFPFHRITENKEKNKNLLRNDYVQNGSCLFVCRSTTLQFLTGLQLLTKKCTRKLFNYLFPLRLFCSDIIVFINNNFWYSSQANKFYAKHPYIMSDFSTRRRWNFY